MKKLPTCAYCRDALPKKPSRHRNARFCTRACKQEYLHKLKEKVRHKLKEKVRADNSF
jgi:hypothetical protein